MENQVNRRTLLTGAVAPAFLRGAAPSARPNIILYITDDHGAQAGYLGTAGLSTPALDRVAGGGARFVNAFSATASCAPSRCSTATGMYPHSNGVWRNVGTGVHADVSTLVEILQRAGYETGHIGKGHLFPPEKFPFNQDIALPQMDERPENYKSIVSRFIQKSGSKPFFLWTATLYPHRPLRKFHFDHKRPAVKAANVELPVCLPDLAEVRADWVDYLTSIQCADANLEGILEGLRASGRERDTIVITFGDQGPCYHRAKATMYDLGIRIGLAMSGPGIKSGATIRELASLIDVAPTVLDFAGLPIPPGMQGRSLRRLLAGEAIKLREFVFSEHNSHNFVPETYPCRSVYDGRMHYIRNFRPDLEYQFIDDAVDAGPKWDNRAFKPMIEAKTEFPLQYELMESTRRRPAEELYDHSADSGEIRNVAADPRFKPQIERLRAALDRWVKDTQDPGDPTKIVRRTRTEG